MTDFYLFCLIILESGIITSLDFEAYEFDNSILLEVGIAKCTFTRKLDSELDLESNPEANNDCDAPTSSDSASPKKKSIFHFRTLNEMRFLLLFSIFYHILLHFKLKARKASKIILTFRLLRRRIFWTIRDRALYFC